jgi:hypothetical protein
MHRALGALVLAFVLCLAGGGVPRADARESVGDAMARAQPVARKWHADAQLVHVEVTGFGFAIGPSGIPDLSRAGPPRLAMFTFASAAEPQRLLRVNVRINEPELPGPQQQARVAMGYKTLFTDFVPVGSVPSTLGVPPAVAGTLDHAVAQAERDIRSECAGARSPMTQSCSLIQQAALHAYPRDAGDRVGVPLWSISFGQHPRWADDVSRVVDPVTGQVIARNVKSRFPAGVIQAVAATVTGVRFFLGGAPSAAQRRYDDLFFYNAAHEVQWELNLTHPAPRRRVSVTVQAVWDLPGVGNEYRETPRVVTIEPDATSTQIIGGANLQGTKRVVIDNPLYESCQWSHSQENERRRQRGEPSIPFQPCERKQGVDIRIWSAGTYEVNFFVDGRRVAAGTFEMSRKEDIYGEVLAHARDRSAPTGEIEFLDAKIAALRFFEADPAGRAPRRFARQFSPAARDVGWMLELKHEPPGRWIALPIEALLFYFEGGGERLLQRKLLHTAVPAEWANTNHSDEFGWDNPYYYDRSGAATPSPGRWQPGTYRVDLFVGARGRSAYKFATGTFEIR